MRPAKRKSEREEDSEAASDPKRAKRTKEVEGAIPPPPPPPPRRRPPTGSSEEKRTSNLLAPIMLLEGHGAAVHTVKFDPTGNFLASGSFDRTIQFWGVYGDCENYMMLKGHKNAILDLQWSEKGKKIFSASADKTVVAWDADVGKKVRKFVGHDSFVNACSPSGNRASDDGDGCLIVSGSDDGTTKIWDIRSKRCVKEFENQFQMTSVAFSKDGETVFAGGLDETIKAWDLRTDKLSFTLEGHTDTITGISLSPDGNHLLSNGMDNRLYMWDVRPFVTTPSRCLRRFEGASHNFEKMLLRCSWSPDGRRVMAGSADRNVYVWDVDSQDIIYCLPGHGGSVNEVVYHPHEPILASCGSDKKIYLGELQEKA